MLGHSEDPHFCHNEKEWLLLTLIPEETVIGETIYITYTICGPGHYDGTMLTPASNTGKRLAICRGKNLVFPWNLFLNSSCPLVVVLVH